MVASISGVDGSLDEDAPGGCANPERSGNEPPLPPPTAIPLSFTGFSRSLAEAGIAGGASRWRRCGLQVSHRKTSKEAFRVLQQ